MAFALLPLAARTGCIIMSFLLSPSHTHDLPTEQDAADVGMSVDELRQARIVALVLLPLYPGDALGRSRDPGILVAAGIDVHCRLY